MKDALEEEEACVPPAEEDTVLAHLCIIRYLQHNSHQMTDKDCFCCRSVRCVTCR